MPKRNKKIMPKRNKKTRSLLERKKANKKARKDNFQKAKEVYKSLIKRTVAEDYKPSPGEFFSLEKRAAELGMVVAGYIQIRNLPGAQPTLGDATDPSFLRGGLTKKEKKLLKKAPVSNKTISDSKVPELKRFIQRQDTTSSEPRITVYLDGNGDFVLFHIVNAFKDEHLESRLQFLSDHFIKCWNKCCGLSGHINWDAAYSDFMSDEKKREAFFGSNYRNFTILSLEVTKEGEGTTGKLYYINPEGELQCF